MTKQEEIKKGMVYQLVEQAENNLLHNLDLMTKSGEERDYLCGVADIILSYLHSQGVVITKHGFYSDLMEPLVKGE